MDEDVFQILEIEPTNDKKEIKKAYARLVKRYHPEEYPEEWKKIHEAYELALKIAQYVKVKEPEPEVKAEVLELQVREAQPEPMDVQPKRKPPVLERKLETEPETTEVTDAEEEMNSLFQDIGKLSKEQQKQKEEEQKKALETAVTELKQMAAKRRLNQKEWEAFFGRADMQPVICTGKFLYELGERFNNKKINTRMYRFLLEQLALIERYRKDNNIMEDSAGVSDPLGYARGKIHSACKAQGRVRDLTAGTTAFVKAVVWLLIVLLSGSRVYLRVMRHHDLTPQERQRQYEQNAEKADRDRELIEELQRMNEQQELIKEELSQSIELVGIGDTREKMISLYGEPDSLQKDPENPNYEEAVYHLYDVDMKITLYIDVVMGVYYEISQDEK